MARLRPSWRSLVAVGLLVLAAGCASRAPVPPLSMIAVAPKPDADGRYHRVSEIVPLGVAATGTEADKPAP